MFRRKTLPFLVLALVILVGCSMNGGGKVAFLGVGTGLGAGVPTEATIAVSVNCSDNKDMFRSNINLVDNANDAHITAHLKWTPVSEFGATTCEEAAANMEAQGISLTFGIIQSQGQENGTVSVAVGQPGAFPAQCGALQRILVQAFEDTPDGLPGGAYFADGCLDHGKISFH